MRALASLSNGNSYQQDANGDQTTRTIASGPLAGTYNLYFDSFVSSHSEYIGLDPNGPALTPPASPPDLAFSDEFESGDFFAWSSAATDGGDLAVTTDAAHQSSYGLKALIDDTASITAYYDSPVQEDGYRLRFYFNPNSLSLANGKAHYIYDGVYASTGSKIVRLELLRENNEYKLRVTARRDDGTNITTAKYAISNDWNAIEVDWQAATSVGANNGSAGLWIDDTQMEILSNLDNDTLRMDELRLGAVNGVDSGTAGAMLFDHVLAHRDTHIGLLAYQADEPARQVFASYPPLPDSIRGGGKALAAPIRVPQAQAVSITFLYDGDGKRVAQTINGVTTYFVGNHYEVTNGVVTKYYFAGGQRIAMRKGGTLSYLLNDHLGSTSLVTNASGNVTSEMRYTAWGEVRYQAGTMPTNYTYTGQYSNVPDFGFIYYNARWYDPYLNRFAQADTIVPGGVQGLDRYAYVNNSPMRYTDPSGHKCVSAGPGDCEGGSGGGRDIVRGGLEPLPEDSSNPTRLTQWGQRGTGIEMQAAYSRLATKCADGSWDHPYCAGGLTLKEFVIIVISAELSPFNNKNISAENREKLLTAAKNWFSDSCKRHHDTGNPCSGATPNALFNWMGENLDSGIKLFPESVTPTDYTSSVELTNLATDVVNAVLSIRELPTTDVDSFALIHWANQSYYQGLYNGRSPSPSYQVLSGGDPFYIIPYGEEDIMACGYVGCQQ